MVTTTTFSWADRVSPLNNDAAPVTKPPPWIHTITCRGSRQSKERLEMLSGWFAHLLFRKAVKQYAVVPPNFKK